MQLAEEWRRIRDDTPGLRFVNHYGRMRTWSRASVVLRLAVGIVLLLAGFIMLFIPGPGIVAILAGLAMIAGESRSLAGRLDRTEFRLRAWWKRRKARKAAQ